VFVFFYFLSSKTNCTLFSIKNKSKTTEICWQLEFTLFDATISNLFRLKIATPQESSKEA
jgi:hypothetical protein